MLDLNTHELSSKLSGLVSKSVKDCVFTNAETINDGRVLKFSTKSNAKFLLMDATSGDPGIDVGDLKAIAPTTKLEKSHIAKAGTLKKFMEIKKGLCIFEVETGCNTMAALLRDTYDQEAKFIIETIAWKGEKFPKAMDAWVEWLEKAD